MLNATTSYFSPQKNILLEKAEFKESIALGIMAQIEWSRGGTWRLSPLVWEFNAVGEMLNDGVSRRNQKNIVFPQYSAKLVNNIDTSHWES